MADPTRSLDLLLDLLRTGVVATSDIMHALGVSQSWVSRAITRLVDDGRVLRIGSTRGARYGLRREIPGIGSLWQLNRIGRDGEVHALGTLYALAANEYYLEPTADAVARGFHWSGLSEGIPYFLQDQRPGGFLGRAVPQRYPELQLPQRVIDWTDDHYLRYLTLRGSDTVSDLILGNVAFDDYLAGLRHRAVIPGNERHTRYPQLANHVMEGGLPGSSAHGEHPKFAALIQDLSGPRQVIVKFSPPTGTDVGQRWSDLLIAEHHAHGVLRAAGLPACESRIQSIEDRMYLEVDRFDRHGAEGRVGVSSLLAIDSSQYGVLDNWIASATRLRNDNRIDTPTLEQVRLVWTFGALIANTDRHFGNLALYDNYTGRFQLAPVYDMLPMLFAPEHNQIVARLFSPPDPTSDTLRAWPRARELAESYWRDLTTDLRIGAEFRAICAACLQTLEAYPRVGAYAYSQGSS